MAHVGTNTESDGRWITKWHRKGLTGRRRGGDPGENGFQCQPQKQGPNPTRGHVEPLAPCWDSDLGPSGDPQPPALDPVSGVEWNLYAPITLACKTWRDQHCSQVPARYLVCHQEVWPLRMGRSRAAARGHTTYSKTSHCVRCVLG